MVRTERLEAMLLIESDVTPVSVRCLPVGQTMPDAFNAATM